MIEKIKRATEDIRHDVNEKDSSKIYGDLRLPTYRLVLICLIARYTSLEPSTQANSIFTVPEPAKTQSETMDRNPNDFWESIWQDPGIAESFHPEFKSVIHLPSTPQDDKYGKCARHMQIVFWLVCYFSWPRVSLQCNQDIDGTREATKTSSGNVVGRTIQFRRFFGILRKLLKRSSGLELRDMPVRLTDVSLGEWRAGKRRQDETYMMVMWMW